MAQSLETLRSSKIASIYGRRLGIDKDDYLVGAPGLKQIIEDITTASTGSALASHGVAQILTSGSSQGPVQINLGAPQPGIRKTIIGRTTSTGSHQFLSTPAGAAIFSASDGSSKGVVNFVGPGGGIVLIGLSTAAWGVESLEGSTAASQPTFSTST